MVSFVEYGEFMAPYFLRRKLYFGIFSSMNFEEELGAIIFAASGWRLLIKFYTF